MTATVAYNFFDLKAFFVEVNFRNFSYFHRGEKCTPTSD